MQFKTYRKRKKLTMVSEKLWLDWNQGPCYINIMLFCCLNCFCGKGSISESMEDLNSDVNFSYIFFQTVGSDRGLLSKVFLENW